MSRRSLSYRLLDVFTDTPLAGNPLAVFPEAARVPSERMQAIARELNLSESVFVTDADPAAARFEVRIMTPAAELPFAGHPSIGAGVALAHRYRAAGEPPPDRITLLESVGEVGLDVRIDGESAGTARLEAPVLPEPQRFDAPLDALARLIGLPREALAGTGFRPVVMSAGVPFLMVPVRSRDDLAVTGIDGSWWAERFKGTAGENVYVFARTGEAEFAVRMFAPAMGIREDPATGAAAVAFAGLLAEQGSPTEGESRYRLLQGDYMDRPSELELTMTVREGALTRVALGGSAVMIGEGRLYA